MTGAGELAAARFPGRAGQVAPVYDRQSIFIRTFLFYYSFFHSPPLNRHNHLPAATYHVPLPWTFPLATGVSVGYHRHKPVGLVSESRLFRVIEMNFG